MHITESEFGKLARDIIDCLDVDADKAVKRAYDILMEQGESHRETLESRNKRLTLIRRAFEAGRREGERTTREEFRKAVGMKAKRLVNKAPR